LFYSSHPYFRKYSTNICVFGLAALHHFYCDAEESSYICSVIPVLTGRKDKKNMLLPIIRFVKAWKRYGAAMQELSHLSDRELADIGITRGDISRVAWEHSRR
jgi:uncharacterized protein YjiS (DUF1127 family)